MDIKFDFLNKRRNPSLILCNPNGEELYSLAMAKNREISISLNEISELTFELSKYKNSEEITPYYDLIKTKRIIKVEDFGQFIITNVEISSDGITEVKQVTCKGLEFELSSKNLDILEGTYALYNPTDTEKSLLHILIGYIPTWSIQEVDSELWSTWRTFDIKDNNIFNFLMEEVQIAFDCVFIFDTFNRRIKVVKTSNLLKTTDIYLSNRNLMKELNISENADNITTALTVYGDGDLSIRTVNPLGTATIYDFSFFATEEWMTKELIVAVNLWQQKIKNAETTYTNKLVAIKNLTNELDTLKNELVNLEIEKKALEQKHSLAVVAGDNANCTIYSNQIKAKDVEISSKKTQIGAKENEITQTQSELTAITKGLSFESNFTKDQLKELSNFIYQSSTQNTNYSTTDLTTIEEQRQIMYDLYNWGKEQLSKTCQPIWEFDVDSINFLNLIEYRDTINEIDLGCEVTIEVDKAKDLYAKAILIGYTLSLDDFTELELKFSSVLNYNSSSYTFEELFNTTASISKSFDFESNSWSMGEKAYSKVNEYINNALDLTNQEIISSDNQEFTITNVGIRGREKNLETNAYKPEQIWINKNTIAFSDDGFNTTKSALGKVILPDGTTGYGLIADYIVGRVLCGQKLILENEKSTFRVDGEKVFIKNADIIMTNDSGKESTLEDALKEASENGGSTSYYQSTAPQNPKEGDIWFDTSNGGNKPKVYINSIWQDATDSDIKALQSKTNEISNNLASSISKVYEDMEQAIKDGEIVIFYQAEQPSNPKEGDLWYDTDDKNKAYVYKNSSWKTLQDQTIIDAIQKANDAQATADGKIKTYYQTTAPTGMKPTDVGDLWIDTDDKNKLYRYNGTSWVSVQDGTIADVSTKVNSIMDANGNLIASKMVGQILTGKSNIVCASATTTGNVLTLNENGIIVATRNSDGTINTSGVMTCITKDGIVADAIKSGGTIQGVTLKGSTIYGGDLAGVYSKISSADPLAVYRPTGKVAELWGAIDGSSYLNLYERSGTQKYRIASGANATSITTIRDTGSIETIADKLISFNGYEGFKVYAWNRTDPYMEIYRNFIGVGHPSAETYIDGSTVYINGVAKGITLSELEVANMELQAENQELALKQSELEVTLMEKGVL